MRRPWLAVLVLAVIGIAGPAWATNQTISVTAKEQDNPQGDPDDVEGHFTNSPNEDKDEIHVTNEDIKGKSAGVYNDPVNDGALLTIVQEEDPVKVDVEGREGIGAMYYVTVVPTGGGGGGGETILWADVEDMKQPGSLVLKDLNSSRSKSDLTDSDDNTPVLYCKTASDEKGDVQFWLNTDSGTYDWVVKQGTTTIASGTLNEGNDWTASQSNLDPDFYKVELTKQGDQNFKRRIDFVVVALDVDITNGGNAGAQGSAVADADEETVGAYLLVNWDNDDADDPPVPDLNENSVNNEDDLARITISISPTTLNSGTLELVKQGGGSSVKIWNSSTKGTEVTDLNWNLATETPPSTLWVEGISASSAERDVELKLQYTDPDGVIVANDIVKATVVMVNLGNAVYREASIPLHKSRGHSAIVYAFTGACNATDLADDTKYLIIEMDGPTDNKNLSTMTNAAGLTCFGCYTQDGISFTERLKILANAVALVGRADEIGYCWEDAIEPANWNDTIAGVGSLRCDGLVEICYEMEDINVWGKIDGGSTHYDIRNNSYEVEHNNYDAIWWKDTLMPATQCGYESSQRGTAWNTTFAKQDLCAPIGTKGGH